MSRSDSTEQQPDVGETQFLSGMAKLTIKEPEVKDLDDDEQCKTPTRPENQIRVLNCPPAPRKKRPTTPSSTSKRLFTIHYIIVLQETIDAFFQACGEQSSSGNKRRRIN